MSSVVSNADAESGREKSLDVTLEGEAVCGCASISVDMFWINYVC